MRLIAVFALFVLSQVALARGTPVPPERDELKPATRILSERGIVVAGLFGGTNPEISRRLASGSVGCPANEIGISNEEAHRGIHTFTAHCKGREYFCTYKYPDPISCSQTAGITDAEVEDHREEAAKEMEAWKEQVMGRLQQAWVKPPEYSNGQRTVMRVKLDERGRLLNLQWISRSGDARVDKSILKAFKQIEPYPIPPDVGAAFSGMEFSFP
ncbi:energy transducer TonB [Tahibacter soli]|uniref:Energy transducer TonB n=1 Tax=Tahibacter soli TaxID=2983605 RepID=A0A9X3YGR8_9GAMM|nr:energy transducer TonB [Tahibacter soli]MDC8010966.1 energy transducer TonB [Tahibacter soli]